ncbi:hypothetical protein COT77_00865 [Candidatus Berkelbacteria bacterium CG10_big_fil_rev_8_21_14_0_10_41_12]|uniref:50S ribosomal protein L21 n=1 Tax=Candidatus Berkelbacteria bacterium CG10_big_fil_rev_8_21_14_0_10_41_12 TaxID=1974513 RepID=A0A2M6WXM8_9BACT|nr:MAG: hypothetical protein COT77_00865 [Candidatus Berkelbacteria bacterium CG10_big_fil_rev_8_21_14_0_10_41_12]
MIIEVKSSQERLDMPVVKIQDKQYFVSENDSIIVDNSSFKENDILEYKCIISGKPIKFKVERVFKDKKIPVLHFKNKTRRLKRGTHRRIRAKLKLVK